MIFLDTSGIYALADRDDKHHGEAMAAFEAALKQGLRFVTHSYVLVESTALLQRRLGLDVALTFLADAAGFDVHWVTEDVHDEAAGRMRERGERTVSLVDEVSFGIMRGTGILRYLGFDKHFAAEGFTQFAG